MLFKHLDYVFQIKIFFLLLTKILSEARYNCILNLYFFICYTWLLLSLWFCFTASLILSIHFDGRPILGKQIYSTNVIVKSSSIKSLEIRVKINQVIYLIYLNVKKLKLPLKENPEHASADNDYLNGIILNKVK